MNFQYEITQTELGSLVIKLKPNPLIKGDYTPLELCLIADIREDDETLNWIDDVLSGKVEKDYCGGDITDARFDKNETVVSYEESTSSNPAKCTLPTWLFREIVEVWLKEAKKHFEETHKAD